MKSAILCFPYIEGLPQYPTGLYKIGTHSVREFCVRVLDARMESDICGKIDRIMQSEDVLCLGVSCMTGPQILSALDLSKRYHGQLPIVWGGSHPTLMPKVTLESGLADVVIRGDGEGAFLELLRSLDQLGSLACSIDAEEQINFFADFAKEYVDFDTYPVDERYLVNRDGLTRAFPLETSRGCAHKCAFCHNTALGRKYRAVSARSVLRVIDELVDRYKIGGIIFQEDNFFLNKERARAIIGGLPERRLGWKANARISYVKSFSPEFLSFIQRSQCHVLQFGVESGSDRILDIVSKGVTASEIREANSRLGEYQIGVRYNFILGFPTETTTDLEKTLTLIRQLKDENPNCLPPFLNIYTPYPGTPLFGLATRMGFVAPKMLEDWAEVHWNSATLPWLSEHTASEYEKLSQHFLQETEYAKFLTAES